MRYFRYLAAAIVPSLVGCVPFPVYKTLQPSATLTVIDDSGSPITGAEVQIVANAYPYKLEKSREVKRTVADGTARFDSRREWRTESLMIHGSEVFYWNWCVRRDGYTTFFTSHKSGREFEKLLTVRLLPGESAPCPKTFR